MDKTPRGLRLHIGFFGKTNAGKSSLINTLAGSSISIVSNIKGTTTDLNQKAMELLPIGPVLLIDTAGIDDFGGLGELRVKKTLSAIDKTDIAFVVCDFDGIDEYEKKLYQEFRKKEIPFITLINKSDLLTINPEKLEQIKLFSPNYINLSANQNDCIEKIKQKLIETLPEDFINPPKVTSGLIKENELALLVIPIDKEAPKGRLILPQVQTIRDLLDTNNPVLICKETGIKSTLSLLKTPPGLVITDSQAFWEVSQILPEEIPLTSFSIVFAKLKGDLKTFVKGANALDSIKNNSKIAICESCTHHAIEDDIARVKIPNLIKKYTQKDFNFEYFRGNNFVENPEEYSLIIHCGACMTNRREVLSRILKANQTPFSNFGVIIAKCLGILQRVVKPFGI